MRANQALDPERSALVASHAWIARNVAWSYGRKLPRSVDREDVLGKAAEALVLLARDWDPERCPVFAAFVNTFLRPRLIDLIRNDIGRHGQRALPTIRLETSLGEDELEFTDVLVDPGPGPEAIAVAFGEDDAATLWALVDELPSRQRLVVRWRYRLGFAQTMVAELLGVTESRVSQIESAAMRALRGPTARADLA